MTTCAHTHTHTHTSPLSIYLGDSSWSILFCLLLGQWSSTFLKKSQILYLRPKCKV